MRKYVLTAALVAAVLPVTPAMARPAQGYTVRSTMLQAGPDRDYPTVRRLRANVGVTVYGCLRNWSWCDVDYRYDRGWVRGRDIAVSYRGRRSSIQPYMGIGILSFMFGTYWDNHYRSRPFYSERPRWEQQYNTNYRPEWGPRHQAPVIAPRQRQPGADMRQGTMPRREAAPVQQPAPRAPRMAPQQHQPAANQHQGNPHPERAAQPKRDTPAQNAAPGNGNKGQAPGQQGRGEQAHPQKQKNADHKSRD